jgi:CxxC motif-containing protein (DUF1111 family)
VNKIKFLFFLVVVSVILSSCSDDDSTYEPVPDTQGRLFTGGETTVFTASSNAFHLPAPNLTADGLNEHIEGDAHFESAFISAPAEINGGLGPIFNNNACESCHLKDGRSPFPSDINGLSGFFLRISLPGEGDHGGPLAVPGFGTQVQNQAIFGFEPEAKFKVTYTEKTETFADGTTVQLQKPTYSLIDPYISLPTSYMLSPRLASPMFGLGLLEAIPESEILANEDISDANGDGISGKANYVYDIASNTVKLGRFGWKANTATVLEQTAGAYNGDMGVTNYYLPFETGYGQTNGDDGLGDDPEITDDILDQVAFYVKTLGVPAARNIDDEDVMRGEQLFTQIDCAKCHIPKMQTGPSDIPALANQTIYPFTDMLLHDMGEDLADHRPDFLANGREWRTKALWGVGLTQLVNGHTDFLHDGRAKNLTEAILWHGGEAENSKNKFKALTQIERKQVLDFIKSL